MGHKPVPSLGTKPTEKSATSPKRDVAATSPLVSCETLKRPTRLVRASTVVESAAEPVSVATAHIASTHYPAGMHELLLHMHHLIFGHDAPACSLVSGTACSVFRDL
jgi:hypothetical protein